MVKKAKKKKQAKGKAELLEGRFFSKLLRLSADLWNIADCLGDCENVSTESMLKRKLTREELCKDIERVWDNISASQQHAWQIRKDFPQLLPDTVNEVLIVLGMINGPIDRALWEFNFLNWPEDKKLFYKHTHRAYKRANEHRQRLEFLSSKLAVDAEEELFNKVANKAQNPTTGDQSDLNKYGTVTYAAKLFGVKTSRMTQLCNEKKIKSIGKGRERRVELFSLIKYQLFRQQRKKQSKINELGEDAIRDTKEVVRDDKKLREER